MYLRLLNLSNLTKPKVWVKETSHILVKIVGNKLDFPLALEVGVCVGGE